MTPRILVSTLLIAALALLSACVSSTTGRSRTVDNRDEKPDRKVFVLDRIQIDREAVANGAKLLFTEPAPGYEQGLSRYAAGSFSVSDRGFCRLAAWVFEPAMGLDGRRNELRYELLMFNGVIDDDGAKATAHTGVGISEIRPGQVKIDKDGADTLWFQPIHNGKLLAYRYRFNRALVKAVPVAFPWR